MPGKNNFQKTVALWFFQEYNKHESGFCILYTWQTKRRSVTAKPWTNDCHYCPPPESRVSVVKTWLQSTGFLLRFCLAVLYSNQYLENRKLELVDGRGIHALPEANIELVLLTVCRFVRRQAASR
ncbi:MAG TPA: hypothetical protein PKA10_00935 [Selenomonadales bacterium]|nr:hypothetical protein [Selenomonadales bacterium]